MDERYRDREYIDKYLKGELTPSAKAEFEDMLDRDPALKRKVLWLKQRLPESEETGKKTHDEHRGFRIGVWWWIILALILAVALYYVIA